MSRLLLFLLIVWPQLALRGQNLEECRRLARENYPEIRQYDLLAQTEQYNLSNVARAWIPQVTLSGQATWQSAAATFPEAFDAILAANGMEMTGIRKNQYRMGVDISQTIWDGGESRARRTLTRAETEADRQRVNVELYELQTRVDNLYFGILLLEERRAQTEAQIGLLQRILERIRTGRDNGVAKQSDADAVEAELLTVEQALTQTETSCGCYRQMLEIFIGRPLEAHTLERPELPDVNARTLCRPELDLFEAQKQQLDAQRHFINSSLRPRFSAFAQGYYGYPGLDMFRSMRSSDGSFNALIGVRMTWNIGAFYTRRNQLGKLRTAQQQVDLQRDIFVFNVHLQTARDESEITRLRRILDSDGRIVDLRRSVRMAAESQLENGVIDATDLMQKITDETAAMLNRSSHEIELLQALYRLKHTLNQ